MNTQQNEIPWTQFHDMHSGGGLKEKPYSHIYIQAPENEARVIFYNRFGHSPDRVTCTCCGEDYSITQSETLQQATAYNRGCDYAYFNTETGEEVPGSQAWKSGVGVLPGHAGKYVERGRNRYGNQYQTVEQYITREEVLVIRAEEIKPEERIGEVTQQGYVWR